MNALLKRLPGNYRPIYLLSQFSKIFEKIIKNRMNEFMNKFSKINESQFGFRQNSSTNDALNYLMENITNNLESKLLSAILSIDLCKAFDTIDHELLILKMENYGFRGVAKDFFLMGRRRGRTRKNKPQPYPPPPRSPTGYHL